jgi:hypothetical protein
MVRISVVVCGIGQLGGGCQLAAAAAALKEQRMRQPREQVRSGNRSGSGVVYDT